jgi:hypothetical protein
MVMKPVFAAAMALVVLLGAASNAAAQRDAADRADRGQRLDSDAFRNDMLQDQLRQPAKPQGWQTTPSPTTSEKPKADSRKKKPN